MDYKAASDKEIIEEARRRWPPKRIVQIASPTRTLKQNQVNVWYNRGLSKAARARLETALTESAMITVPAVMEKLEELRSLLTRVVELLETSHNQGVREEVS